MKTERTPPPPSDTSQPKSLAEFLAEQTKPAPPPGKVLPFVKKRKSS